MDTLAEINQVTQTSFVDTSMAPNRIYEYRVSVVNTSDYEVVSPVQRSQGYEVGPVVLLDWKVEPQQGSVILYWSPYRGPRFEHYTIERRRAEEVEFAVLAQIPAVGDTSYRDEGLEPEAIYFYRIGLGVAYPGNRRRTVRLRPGSGV